MESLEAYGDSLFYSFIIAGAASISMNFNGFLNLVYFYLNIYLSTFYFEGRLSYLA